MKYKAQYFMDFLWLLLFLTIPSVFLLLTSCASVPKQEPWAIGECVEFTPRSTMGRIVDVTQAPNGENLYSIDFFKEESKNKVLTEVPCNKEGYGKPFPKVGI